MLWRDLQPLLRFALKLSEFVRADASCKRLASVATTTSLLEQVSMDVDTRCRTSGFLEIVSIVCFWTIGAIGVRN